ncbi:MAG TPA: IS1182 family transposase [Mycobacterium sp.]|nr:IS1182 family transposase [Mycobacterium sp.]
MLAGSERQQGFFDAAWCSGLLAENSIYALLACHGDRIVRDADFAECYSARWGRPSIAPSLLAKVLLLAYREGLSDRRAMEALRFDLRWKVALDLPIDHPGFHPTSLVKFRARLLLHGKERIVFERSLALATEFGVLDGSVEQIVDSTPMLGAAAIQDTVTLVRAAVRKLIDAVAALDPGAAGKLRTALAFDYARPRQKPAADWHDKPAREAMLVEVASDAQRALHAVGRDPGLGADEAVGAAAGLLQEIVGQEFETDEHDQRPRPRHGRRPRQVISAHDPEMRHGRKTNARRFTGYKLHVAVDAQAPVITAVTISPGNEHDGHHAAALVEQQPASRRPQRVLGDTAYGNLEVREQLEQRATRVLAPLHLTRTPDANTVDKDQFDIDLTAERVTCPQGKTAPIFKPRPSGPRADGVRHARFTADQCAPCPLRERCAPAGHRYIRVNRREDLRQAALRELADPTQSAHLRRTRPRIERLLGLIVYRYHARTSRYNGARKTELQAAWTATLVNLHPIGRALRTQTP